jgi:hypothetical protein
LSGALKYFYKYYILDSLFEIITALVLIFLIIFSIDLSTLVDINSLPQLNDAGILYFFTSILVFILILAYFTSIIINYRERLAIYDIEKEEYIKNFNTIVFLILAYLFVFAIYILLDVFFGDVYLFFWLLLLIHSGKFFF